MTKTVTLLFTLALAASAAAQSPDVLARFGSGVGVIPAQSGVGQPNDDGTLPNVKLNVVRGVNPGAGPWTISGLKATITTDGHITANGRGLLLASGNSIGTTANLNVFATLFCETTAPFVAHSTSFSVPLQANGNFQIDDTIVGLPTSCVSPVLLIRASVPGGPWLAAGLQKFDDGQ
jgi:hypothetical protein